MLALRRYAQSTSWNGSAIKHTHYGRYDPQPYLPATHATAAGMRLAAENSGEDTAIAITYSRRQRHHPLTHLNFYRQCE